MSTICLAGLNLYFISRIDWLQNVASTQQSYKVEVAKIRGTIYDCNKNPIVNKERNKKASICPSSRSKAELSKILPKEKMNEILSFFSSSIPFSLEIPDFVDNVSDSIIFNVPKRYVKDQLCSHIIGYLDETSNGVCGLEKSFNEYLLDSQGEISLNYEIDAKGRKLGQIQPIIKDTSYLASAGVELSIDLCIQEITQKAMDKHIRNGAAVVLKVPDASVKACVSIPGFSPNSLEEAIKNNNSPLVNKAFSSYNVGSIFKLVIAAAALESGISNDEEYDCKGNISVDDTNFHCFASQEHGSVNMENAMKFSCNTYFIDLAKKIKSEAMLDLSYKMGFGKENEIAPDIVSDCGNLPKLSDLEEKAELANFSFGQGSILATPLQIAELTNTIASGGLNTKPHLVDGLLNESLELVEKFQNKPSIKVLSENTAQKLKTFMKASIEEGTSSNGNPKKISAAAKTSTAQTGKNSSSHELTIAWFAGFFPYEKPEYVVVVLAEDAESGGRNCGPVFSEIADEISTSFSLNS
jgi:cell division protein FtsI/penicillin-binding protein 2